MYCRECGIQMSEGSLKCNKCGTKNGQGVNYCNMCGYHTTIKTEFCFNCGAKQHNIVSQKMKEERIKELQKKLKLNKKMMDIEKFISVASVIIGIVLIVWLIFRPEPDNIPDISNVQVTSDAYIHDSMTRIGNSYYYDSSYISDDVAEYWIQGRALIGYILISLVTFVVSIIRFNIHKKLYKKTLKEAKEVKNVL